VLLRSVRVALLAPMLIPGSQGLFNAGTRSARELQLLLSQGPLARPQQWSEHLPRRGLTVVIIPSHDGMSREFGSPRRVSRTGPFPRCMVADGHDVLGESLKVEHVDRDAKVAAAAQGGDGHVGGGIAGLTRTRDLVVLILSPCHFLAPLCRVQYTPRGGNVKSEKKPAMPSAWSVSGPVRVQGRPRYGVPDYASGLGETFPILASRATWWMAGSLCNASVM